MKLSNVFDWLRAVLLDQTCKFSQLRLGLNLSKIPQFQGKYTEISVFTHIDGNSINLGKFFQQGIIK